MRNLLSLGLAGILLCSARAEAVRELVAVMNLFPIAAVGTNLHGHVCNIMNVGRTVQHVTVTGLTTNNSASYHTVIEMPPAVAPAVPAPASIVKPTQALKPLSSITISFQSAAGQNIRALSFHVAEDRGAIAVACQNFFYDNLQQFYTTSDSSVNGGRPF